MSLTLRWVNTDESDRVAETRMLSFGSAFNELESFKSRMAAEKRVGPGDWLLAERDGQGVGTATSFSFNMWVRGASLPCQGIGDVGTVKTARRAGLLASGQRAPGVATAVMNELIRKARERGEVLSALLPFRASFYEHFGYGIVERRLQWTIPLSVMPSGSCESMRFYRDGDLDALAHCRQRIAEAGQCDMERSPEHWQRLAEQFAEGQVIVDQPEPNGPIHSWIFLVREVVDGRRLLRVRDRGADSLDALRRQFCFLSSLRDQYESVTMLLPRDLDIHWLLRETHIANITAPVQRAGALLSSRMQIRVLDHKRFLESIHWPAHTRGHAVIAIHEPEGETSTFELEVADARARADVKPSTNNPDLECPARVWAAIACGDLSATRAAGMGLATATRPDALPLLDALSIGPAPFCGESF